MAKYGEVGVTKREIRDASQEDGHTQKRIRKEGQEPQASDRDRPQRSPKEGRKGAPQEVEIAVAALSAPAEANDAPAESDFC
jgi:hypothetical protein